MILVLVTGHALASAWPVERLLQRLMATARTPSLGLSKHGFVTAMTGAMRLLRRTGRA